LTKRLRHPKHALREQQQKLDHLEWRLRQALIKNQQNPARRLEKLQTKLQPFNPLQQIQTLRLRVARAHDDLLKNTLQNLHAQRQRLQYLVALLDGISPLNTLKRGYAIVQDEQHNTLTNASTTTVGAHVYVRLFNGQLACVVKTIEA
jgi:exodeoxyribonuclease VII large subunit